MTTGLMQRGKACFTSNKYEYITPSWLYDELNKRFHFTLDPCTSADNPLNAPKLYTKQDDGLKQSWANESVYVNPPY